MIKLILIFLFSFSALAGTMPNNDYKLGKGSDVVDKGFTFDTGDGANNPTLKVDDNQVLKYDKNSFMIGNGSELSDKSLIFNTGDDSDNPSVGYDATKDKLIFKNRLGNEKVIGSGSGGGGVSVNNAFTEDQNANAEDGTTGWTASAGTFAASDTDPLEGELSFTWTPAAQNDTLTSPVLDFDKDVFRGRACEARFEAIGGDENLTIQVIDGNDDVVSEKVYSAQTVSAPFSVYFGCPTQAAITSDAEKGNLKFRLLNAGASASALIKFDVVYAGTLIGLSETVLPDRLDATFNCSSSSSVIDGSELLSSVGNISSGKCNLVWNSGQFTIAPKCQLTGSIDTVQLYSLSIFDVTSSGATIECLSNSGSTACTGISANISCAKQGVDAKQSAQVFYSIPKIAENVNEFSGFYDHTEATLTNAVKGQNTTWITNTTKSETSNRLKTFTVPSGIFSQAPNCTSTGDLTGINLIYRKSSSSATSLLFETRGTDASNSDQSFSFICQKAGADFKLPIVQPILIANGLSRIEGESAKKFEEGWASFGGASDGTVCTSSPCTRYREIGNLGRNMTVTRSGTGEFSTSVTGFAPNADVFCSCQGVTTSLGARRICIYDNIALRADSGGTLSFNMQGASSDTGTLSDVYFTIYCKGQVPL